MLKSSHLVREKMTEATRRNRFWNYESPNCCNSGALNNIHRTEGKWCEKDCALSTSPRKLIVGEERGHPQRVKRVSRICQAADCSDSAQERRIGLAQSPGPGKGLHGESITEIALRVGSVMLPNCPILFFLIINLKTGASFLA